MTDRLDPKDVVARCVANQRSAILEQAVASRDLIAMLIVSVFDLPIAPRLWLLYDQPKGPVVVSAIVVAGVDQNDGPITDLAYKAIEDRGEYFPLDNSQADLLLERVGQTEEPLDDEQGATVLGWVAAHQPKQALAFSVDRLTEAPAAAPTALQQRALTLAGASSITDLRMALLDWAGRCYEAGQPQPAGEILGFLQQPTDPEVTLLIPYLVLHAQSNWGLAPGVLKVIAEMDDGQFRAMGRAVPNPIPEAWFNQHLLPNLFRLHAARLVEMLDEDWWQPTSLAWIADQAPWSEAEHELLLPQVLRALRTLDNDQLQAVVRNKLRERVEAAPPEHDVKAAYPLLGSQALLAEALNNRIPTTDSNLIQALTHLSATSRQRVYADANWKSPARATRLGEVIAAVDVVDASSKMVIAAAFDLPEPSVAAWLKALSPDLDEDMARILIARSGGNTGALRALATGSAAADLLLESWASTQDLTAFDALAGSVHDLARLDTVPQAVRSHPGSLSIADRRTLLDLYHLHRDRRPVLLGLLEDRKAPRQRPSSELLIAALELLGNDLVGEDPGDALDVLAEICSTHRDVPVRNAVYKVLGQCRPTEPLVGLLLRRQEEDRGASAAVADAVRAVGKALNEWAADSIGNEHIEVIQRLTVVDPAAALPYARAILENDTDSPPHRALAAEILGHHGDDTDIARLETAHSQEPNPDTEQVLAMAIRRRKVGDLAAAHQRLGELAGLEETSWHSLDEKAVWDRRGAALVEALDRITKHQANQDHGSAIDQLSEVAKVVLFRSIDIAGDDLALSQTNRERVRANIADYGEVLGWLQKNQSWPEIVSLATLYDLRTEHVTPKGSHEPNRQPEPDDYGKAEWLFQRGVCAIIRQRLIPNL